MKNSFQKFSISSHLTSSAQGGLTLIETLIYSVLVVAVLSLAMIAIYQIIRSEDLVMKKQALTENQRFILQKIAWVLKDVNTINSPVAGETSLTLSVNKSSYAYNPLIVSLNNGVLELTSGATTTALSNNQVVVDAIDFAYYDYSTSSIIKMTAILSADAASTSINATIGVR